MARYIPIKQAASKDRRAPGAAKKLEAALHDYLAEQNRQMNEFYEHEGLTPDDMFVDVQIWVGSAVDKYTDSGADLVLAYDGAGYDYLSPYADYPSVSDAHREKIIEIAEQLGFFMEDLNSWSAGFYYEGPEYMKQQRMREPAPEPEPVDPAVFERMLKDW